MYGLSSSRAVICVLNREIRAIIEQTRGRAELRTDRSGRLLVVCTVVSPVSCAVFTETYFFGKGPCSPTLVGDLGRGKLQLTPYLRSISPNYVIKLPN
jgi:hypothetical protein